MKSTSVFSLHIYIYVGTRAGNDVQNTEQSGRCGDATVTAASAAARLCTLSVTATQPNICLQST